MDTRNSTVVAFEIPRIDDPKCTNVKKFRIKEFEDIKKNVSNASDMYEEPNTKNSKMFYGIIRQFEHASTFRQDVHTNYNTPNVGNAWLKAYELFSHYKVFPIKPTESYIYFDNAAFPGTFILAAWHYVNTLCDIKDFQWYGSSFLTDDALMGGKGFLEDIYKLYANYPNNWLMGKNNNGDVTVYENQMAFEKILGGSVDLYTSDLGFDVSHDYNRQEELQSHANLGQIVTALLVLKKGGIMITKQYSYFEPFTISLMGLLTLVFDRVEICKPMFSKSGNSETYLVGLGYKPHTESNNNSVVRVLLDRLKNWSLKPLTTKGCLGDAFLRSITDSQKYFSREQITKLVGIISEYNRFMKSKRIDRKYVTNTNKFRKQNILDLKKWTVVNPMKPLPPDKRLNVKEVLAWKPRGRAR
jgi:23S rRNA U2552 (ribose-2'-O)-methylase RlmE/FtsJ